MKMTKQEAAEIKERDRQGRFVKTFNERRKEHLCAKCDQRAGYIKHFYLPSEWLCEQCANEILKETHYIEQHEKLAIEHNEHPLLNWAIFNRRMSFSERLEAAIFAVQNSKKVNHEH
jgi:hypothetical protein